MDQAEQDIESLAIKASISFITFYNTTTTAAVGKAMKSVEGLMLKLNDMGNNNADNPYGNYRLILDSNDFYDSLNYTLKVAVSGRSLPQMSCSKT